MTTIILVIDMILILEKMQPRVNTTLKGRALPVERRNVLGTEWLQQYDAKM